MQPEGLSQGARTQAEVCPAHLPCVLGFTPVFPSGNTVAPPGRAAYALLCATRARSQLIRGAPRLAGTAGRRRNAIPKRG